MKREGLFTYEQLAKSVTQRDELGRGSETVDCVWCKLNGEGKGKVMRTLTSSWDFTSIFGSCLLLFGTLKTGHGLRISREAGTEGATVGIYNE